MNKCTRFSARADLIAFGYQMENWVIFSYRATVYLCEHLLQNWSLASSLSSEQMDVYSFNHNCRNIQNAEQITASFRQIEVIIIEQN